MVACIVTSGLSTETDAAGSQRLVILTSTKFPCVKFLVQEKAVILLDNTSVPTLQVGQAEEARQLSQYDN